VNSAITPGPYIVNGKTPIGWRIDSVSENAPVGIEMLQNPVAIALTRENAELLATSWDLLSVLKKIIGKYSASLNHELAEEAKAVIRRAEGGA
jgi:hypothetical protein